MNHNERKFLIFYLFLKSSEYGIPETDDGNIVFLHLYSIVAVSRQCTAILVNIDRSLAIYRDPQGGTPGASDPISEPSTPVDEN